jgi:hypothetical protein
MRITPEHRQRLEYYLKNFYKYYPQETYTIFHFVKFFKRRLGEKNKDAWCGVIGETSSGKSMLGLMSGILLGRPYDLTKNVTYIPTGNEIKNKFLKLKFNHFQVDEAAKEMRGVNWHSKAQQDVNTAAMTERYLNNWVMLMMPNFNEFTKSLRVGSLIFRIVVAYRTNTYARVIVQRKSRNWRSDDPWGDKAANEVYAMLDKKKKEITNDTILQIERSLPNTLMDFIIPNLELILPDVTEEYKRLKEESRQDKPESITTQKTSLYKDKYESLMAKVSKILYHNELNLGKVKVSKIEVASKLGCTVDTLNRYLLMQEEPKKKPFFQQQVEETP